MHKFTSRRKKSDSYLLLYCFYWYFSRDAYLWRASKFVTTPQVLGRRRHKLWLIL